MKPGMCSVLGCASWRRGAQRFNLPEDPERRLEWVQFIFEVNGQRLKESSWTDISICSEHFTGDCFENLPGSVQLKARAVPSQCVEPVETADVACQCDDPGSYAVTTEHMQMQHNVANKEKRHQMFIVNERCLFQLFRRKCPSCGRKLRTEKVTRGVLIVLNQRCLRCEYRNQWKSQVDACVSPNEDQHLTEDAEAASTGDSSSSKTVSEVVTFSDEESDSSDGGEDDDEAEVSSEGEWTLNEHIALAEELTEDETDDEGEEEEDFISQSGLKINELCTECGCFFNVRKPHTCEHKIKPYSCNICGKRCVTELSLKSHSTIHNETYEHPCKFCHMTFKTRLDKLKHEQIHQERRDPYKCPDCPETFATNGERRVHLSNHRTPKAVNCGICRMGFTDVHHLQRHSVVHTGLKPYKCSVCQRGFNQGSHLKSHMRLHTGERPFKCQHCDKHFNHNVSLKSHVQRHHSSSSGRKQRINKGSSGAGDADVNGNKKDTKSHCETVEEQDTEEEVQKEKMRLPKSRWRCTGRPKGRPKRNTEGNIAAPGQQEKPRLITKSVKPKRLKIACSSEDEQSDSDVSLNSAEDSEEAEEKEAAKKSTRTARGRKSKRSDSDCDPGEETNRKRYSSQNSDNGKSPGRSRGRTEKAF